MAYALSPIAVSTSADGRLVARFSHDFPLLAVDAAGERKPREAEGCCGSLAKAVADCEAVVCTAIGRGAAAHLAEAGVQLVVVPEGTTVEAAIASYRAGGLKAGGTPTACAHGHQETRQNCGCSGH